jgi:hypothetical protein
MRWLHSTLLAIVSFLCRGCWPLLVFLSLSVLLQDMTSDYSFGSLNFCYRMWRVEKCRYKNHIITKDQWGDSTQPMRGGWMRTSCVGAKMEALQTELTMRRKQFLIDCGVTSLILRYNVVFIATFLLPRH